MSTNTTIATLLKGGEFLIKDATPESVFTPEQFTEEQTLIGGMTEDFVNNEVLPKAELIDHQEPGLTQSLLDKAGELGLLGMSIPEQYGGSGQDMITSTLMTEKIGASGSFAVSLAAHTGIGTLPILYFGTEEQKQKYLPKLASGEWKASYCLTEPGSGSDALAAKTNAVLDKDGKNYILNGQKMWITNGGFADVYIVFAKIDGDKFTGFIVDGNSPSLTRGAEERKMGIKGSSTCQIFFENVKVPAEHVLGEIGKGHLIAFNILNIGRQKLCAAAMGGAKRTATMSVQYANTREQFKQPISNFGAIKYKLAEQAIRIYTNESALYRTAFDIEEFKNNLLANGKPYHEALMGAAEEYAVECAILKVYGSEMLDYVVDENVQIHGGMGFSEEMAAARAYRDSRINRIFEGTNEINRLLTVDMLLKRAMKGRLDLMSPAMKIQQELMAIPDFNDNDEDVYAYEKKLVKGLKKTLLLTAGAAVQKLMMQLENEQEILMNIADVVSEIYLCESVLMRVEKLTGDKSLQDDMMRTYLNDAAVRVNTAANNAINSFADGDEQRMMLLGIKRFTKTQPFNAKDARRRIADKLIAENRYCF